MQGATRSIKAGREYLFPMETGTRDNELRPAVNPLHNKKFSVFPLVVRLSNIQGRAKLMELSLVTHVPSGPIGCAWAGRFAWQK